MSSSKFQDIRAALVTAINSRFTTDAITDVVVTEYVPTGEVTREDRVWLERIRVIQQPLTMGGTGRAVGEDIEIDLRVWAPRSGADLDDLKLAEQRAEAIFASIENALRNDSDVGNTLMFADIDSFESIPIVDTDGAAGMIEAVVTGQSNI